MPPQLSAWPKMPVPRAADSRRFHDPQETENMPEAVIVDAVRTPIGRAFKGSLTGVRPDDLGAFVVDQLLERNPDVKPEDVEDLVCGCGLPQGEQSYNIGRIIGLLSRLPNTTTGTTVHRYCASSLQAIRIAAHAVKAGEGHTFISAGVEHVSRVGPWSEDGLPQLMGAIIGNAPDEVKDQIPKPEFKNEKVDGRDGRTDAYISMGDTAENVADKYDVQRDDMDRYAQRSQERAVEARDSGFFDREIVAVELPDGGTVDKDDGPRADSTLERLQSLKPVFRDDGRVTAGNSCPLNDGAAAVLIMSEDRARRARPQAARADRRLGHERSRARDHGRRPDRRDQEGARARRHVDRRRRHRRAERGLRRAGHPDRRGVRHRLRQAQPARRRDRPRPSVRHDRRANHDHAAERARDERRPDRPRDHVRGRRAGHGHGRRATELSALGRESFMAPPGDTFVTQDEQTLTVLISARESNGELLEVESTWAPMDSKPPAHFHPHQHERFEVLEGELTVDMDGRTRVVPAGEIVEVPPGKVHRMWNGGTETCRARWQVRPALRTEELFAAIAASRAHRKGAKGGSMTPVGAGPVLREFSDEFRLAVPAVVTRPLLATMSVLARARGYPRIGGSELRR